MTEPQLPVIHDSRDLALEGQRVHDAGPEAYAEATECAERFLGLQRAADDELGQASTAYSRLTEALVSKREELSHLQRQSDSKAQAACVAELLEGAKPEYAKKFAAESATISWLRHVIAVGDADLIRHAQLKQMRCSARVYRLGGSFLLAKAIVSAADRHRLSVGLMEHEGKVSLTGTGFTDQVFREALKWFARAAEYTAGADALEQKIQMREGSL